jgi:hypothetical protein
VRATRNVACGGQVTQLREKEWLIPDRC